MSIEQTPQRKRLLVLTSTFPRWKGDHEPGFVFELSRRLGDQYDVMVLAPHAPGAKRIEDIDGIKIYRFKYFSHGLQTLAYNGGILANLKKNKLNYLLIPFFIFSAHIHLTRLVRRFHIDVIHAHWLIPQGGIAIAARLLARGNPAILCTSHGGDLFGLSGHCFKWLKCRIIRHVEKMTVVSHAMREYATKLSGRDHIEIIPMGVDLTKRFTPDPKINRSREDILFVGRLVEKKGVRYLLHAMQEVLKKHPTAVLRIAGDGPEKEMLQQFATDIGIANQVVFLGPIDNTHLPELYGSATIFVAPSIVAQDGDQEGLGLVLVEALGCECPVVASDLPAIRDVVNDGTTGLLCRQKDSADLAYKILYLLDNPEKRQSIAKAGRQYVLENFDWDYIARRYSQTIAGLCMPKP